MGLNRHITESEEEPSKTAESDRFIELSLCGSGLTDFPQNHFKEKYISKLNLSRNELTTLPDQLSSLKFLHTLDVSHNKLMNLPNCILHELRALRRLTVSFNRLKRLDRPVCISILKELRADHNNFPFPNWLVDERFNLDVLDLAANPLFKLTLGVDVVPGDCQGGVKRLNWCNTSSTDGTLSVIHCFKGIEILDISNDDVPYCNRIDLDLPRFFETSPTLAEIRGVNLCAGFCPDLTGYTSLRVFDWSKNQIHWLHPSVTSCTSLTSLVLSSTYLCYLPDDIGNLINLIRIDLSRNSISVLPESFNKLVNLQYLDLYDNELSFPPDLHQLESLNALDLAQNMYDANSTSLSSSLNYEDLKNNLRSQIEGHRLNTVKYAPSDSLSEPETTGSHVSWSCELDDESCVFPENTFEPVEAPEEDWDLNDFAPRDTHVPNSPPEFTDETALFECLSFCPDSIRNSLNFYQPIASRYKPSYKRGQRKNSDTSLGAPEEGQFDDAV